MSSALIDTVLSRQCLWYPCEDCLNVVLWSDYGQCLVGKVLVCKHLPLIVLEKLHSAFLYRNKHKQNISGK